MKDLTEMTLEELWALFPIVLKQSNPAYPSWYAEEEEHLVTLLGRAYISRISHIGSTAVPGLVAKPILDILLELPDDRAAVSGLLQSHGWILMQQDKAKQALVFNRGYTQTGFAEKVFHLHVRPPGDWPELYFRDYLRAYPAVARQYEALKLQLKAQFEHNRDGYTEAKSDFITKYTQLARKEFPGRYLPPEP